MDKRIEKSLDVIKVIDKNKKIFDGKQEKQRRYISYIFWIILILVVGGIGTFIYWQVSQIPLILPYYDEFYKLENYDSGDTELPEVIKTFPEDGQEVNGNIRIEAVFNKDIDSSTITNTNFYAIDEEGNKESAKVSYDKESKTAYLDSLNGFYYGTFTVTVSKNIKDLYGNSMEEDKKWSFAVTYE